MAAFIDILKHIGAKILELTKLFAGVTADAQLEFDMGSWLTIVLVILCLLGSACWAASIAASRRHPLWLHFAIGFVVPWIYPIFILFKMDIHGEAERRRAEQEALQKKAEAEAEKQRIQEQLGKERELQNAESGIEGKQWNQKYFEKIGRDDEGRNAGPWKAVISGNEIIVLEILETEPELVYVVFKDSKGTPKKMRIPYARIESWNKTYDY